MKVNFYIVGKERLDRQLENLKNFTKKQADPVFRKYASGQADKLKAKAYPPMLPNQKYRRTMKLKNSFGFRKLGPSNYAVTNNREGAKWVIKRGMQNRRYHLGRWWTMEDELQKGLPILRDQLAAEIEETLD